MKKIIFIILTVYFYSYYPVFCQNFAFGDQWYNNPLGFDPVQLHTKNGFIIPFIAVSLCLFFTANDSSIKQHFAIFNESGISWGYKYPYTTLFQNNSGIEYFLRKWMSVGTEVSAYFPKDGFNSTAGIGIRPFARFYPVNIEKLRLYFESGGGIIYFLDNFPNSTDKDGRLGTNWNGTTKYGFGGDINIDQSVSLHLGLRHIHVSNGNTKGTERNPSHDSNGLFIGFSYKLEKL